MNPFIVMWVFILFVLVTLWELFKLAAVIVLAIIVIGMVTGCNADPQPPVQQTLPVQTVDKRPRMCDNLYNVGKHREWAECMGVGYVDDTN